MFRLEEDSMTNMVEVSKSQRTYFPAASYDVFLPFYDLIAKLLGADQARRTLLEQAPLRPGDHALDIGCGTGTFCDIAEAASPFGRGHRTRSRSEGTGTRKTESGAVGSLSSL